MAPFKTFGKQKDEQIIFARSVKEQCDVPKDVVRRVVIINIDYFVMIVFSVVVV